MNADGSGVQELTARETGISAPTWSPAGRHIAFAGPDEAIFVMRADGGERHRLPKLNAGASWPSWSPDGRLILVTSASEPEQLWTIRPDGSAPKQLSEKGAGEGAWAPDGRRIAFASSRDGNPDAADPDDWNEEIYVMNRDGSNATRVTRIAGNDHWPPAWSPDGRHVAFTSDGCKSNWEILVADARGSRVLNLTNHPSRDVFPSWHR